MDRAIWDADEILQHASPVVHQAAHEVQPYGHLIRMPTALAESACREKCRKPQSTARRFNDAARFVQEASVARIRTDLLPTSSVV